MKFLWSFALVTIVASTVCRKDSDCKPGDECNKGQCEKNRLVVIPSNCGSNQEWKACATCEPTCDDPTPMCTRECKPAQCQCAKNFVKYYERCIPLKECPNRSTTTSRPPTTTRTSTTDECRFDRDCPSGFACGHGFCSPLERVSTKAPNQAGVRKGNLLDDCRGDDDCRSDLHCSNSRCIFRPTTRRPLSRPTTEETFTAPPVVGLSGTCRRDRDCPPKLLCVRGGRCADKDEYGKRQQGEVCEFTAQCDGILLCRDDKCVKANSRF